MLRSILRRQSPQRAHDRKRTSPTLKARVSQFETLENRQLLSTAATPRIVAGQSTSAFPSVGIVGDRSDGFCSGTLINATHVLTAAHCVDGMGATAGRFTVGGATYSTSAVVPHPNYNDNQFGTDRANDIAIMRLTQPVSGVAPSLVFRGTPQVGQMLTLVGFGAGGSGENGHNGDFGTKRIGTTPIEQVTRTLIHWTFDRGESDTAPGDSGGPAFVQAGGVYYVAGITSGGSGPNGYGSESFDTRVDPYASWIDSVAGTTGLPTPNPDPNPEPDPDPNPGPNPNPAPVDDDHANDIGPDATEIILVDNGQASATGELEVEGDRDVFHVTVDTAGSLVVDLTGLGGVDTYLHVYDADGNLIGENDDSGGTLNSRIELAVEPGVYFVSAGSYDDSETGDYRLDVTLDSDDHGDSRDEATKLTMSATGAAGSPGVIGGDGDRDYFQITANRSGQMTITATAGGSDLDTIVAVYDSRGRRIALNDDWSGTDSRAVIRARAGQVYFVEVAGYGGSTGGYHLDIATSTTRPPSRPPRSAAREVVVPQREADESPRVALASRLADRFAALVI
jgi:hypothetical protein